MEAIQASQLFHRLAAEHAGVEVWPDPDANEGGWTYGSIVSRFGEGNVRILAYVRVNESVLQRRTYDEAGEDLWITVE